MEIVIWSESQVKKNMILDENSNHVNCQEVRQIKQECVVLKNENGKTFNCDFDLGATIPGTATLALLEQLTGCTTNLNELQNDDMAVEGKLKKIIRMVSYNFYYYTKNSYKYIKME